MGVIALEGMRFHAFHGVYEEERILGGEYVVDVYINTNLDAAAECDDITKAVNYETVYQVCRMEMKRPSRLIETVISRIISRLKNTFNRMVDVRVKVSKLHPPLGGRVDCATVQEGQSFASECARCGKGMVCYGDETCWCHEAKVIFPRTIELMAQEHGACVCSNCIDFYAG